MPYYLRPLTVVALAAVGALATTVAPAGAQAQMPRFEVTPRVGALVPAVDLGKNSEAGDLVQVRIELKTAVTGGLTLQYNPAALPVSFRAALDYTPVNSEARAQPALCGVLTGPGCRQVGIDARYMVATGDALIRAVEAGDSHLYFLGGLGVKRYDFAELVCPTDVEDIVCLLLDGFARDQVNVAIHVGLGLNTRVGPARIQWEFADYMSRHRPGGERSSGEVQQDLLLTVGVRLALGG